MAADDDAKHPSSHQTRLLTELQTELSTLNRVSHRLAMTDAGPSLQKVLMVLLPRLLQRIGKNDDAKKKNRRSSTIINKKRKSPSPTTTGTASAAASVETDSTSGNDNVMMVYEQIDGMYETLHKKLIEMLGHAMKRVREDRECKLPCVAILEILLPEEKKNQENEGGEQKTTATAVGMNSITANPLTINLGLAFLTLGINRCTPVECSSLLPGLLTFLGCNFDYHTDSTSAPSVSIGVGHLTDPSRKIRHDQAWHLILRCLEFISHNPMENAAARRQAATQKSASSVSNNSSNASSTSSGELESTPVASLHETKQVIASNPILAGALFDLFLDVLLYSPVPATSTLIPNGLSTAGHQRLIGGAASEKTLGSCKNWKEEFATRGSLRQLKLKLLDLVAPCRRYALFLPEKKKPNNSSVNVGGSGKDDEHVSEGNNAALSNEETINGPVQEVRSDGMGVSRTVALMVLLTGDSDPDVKSKAESYMRAHMDTYRGKEVPQTSTTASAGASNDNNGDVVATETITVHDALLGNSVALAQSILILAIGGASSLSVETLLISQYKQNGMAVDILQSRLGLTYCANDSSSNNDAAQQQKAFVSCSRMKISELTSTSALKFVGKMLDDNPRLLHVGMDMEEEESDIAAVSIGTLALSVFGDLHRPGSSASLAMYSAASLLNSLCVRLSLFYDARVQTGLNVSGSLERLRVLLARSMKQACSVLAPTSSGESTSLASNNGTKASTVQIDIRDQCYGVVCTLARSQFLLDCGNSNERSSADVASFPLTMISTATLLFGCSSNEVEMLRPRATSALDALLGAYVRVVRFLAGMGKALEAEKEVVSDVAVNPWADISKPADAEAKNAKKEVSTEGLSRSLLPLLWTGARRNQPKSSRLAAARWSSELLLRLDNSNAFHLLCFLSGDDDATVSMIAKHAIGVDKLLGEDNILSPSPPADKIEDVTNQATFSVLMDVIIGPQSQSSRNARPKFADFHVRAQAATVRFLLQRLFSFSSFYGDEDGGLALKEFVLTILKTFAYYKGRSLSREETDLLDECAIALASCTSTSKDARLVVTKHEGVESLSHYTYKDIAEQALTSNSSKARRHLSEVMCHLYEDHTLWGGTHLAELSISAWVGSSGLANVAKSCGEKLGTMFESTFLVGEVHGAAFLGASCVRAFRLAVAKQDKGEEGSIISDCWDHGCNIVSLLGKGLSHSDVAIGNACSKGIVIAFSYDGRDAPVLHQKLFDAMAIAMGSMNSALKKYSSIDHADPTRASSLIQAAGLLLAASTFGAGYTKGNGNSSIDLGPARLQCTEALFAILGSAVYRKDDELSLIVGEALVKYADALGSGEWSSGSDSEWKEGSYDESYAFELPPHRHVLYTMFRRELLSSNPLKRNSCAATLLGLIGHASRMANMDPSSVQRAFVQEMWKNLGLFQNSFIKLLADPKSKQLSRESCCKGLAACRGLAAVMASSTEVGSDIESLNEPLLKAFGQTTNYGGSSMQETETQASQRRNENEESNETTQETQVGGAAGISESTLGAYREMASAALSLGQVDVLYSLMILSTNHPMWLMSEMKDRYSAKALLGKAEGASVEEIRVSLRPHLGKLIPKLLRACNDPNKQTREQMSNLWQALTGGGAESRALVTQNLLPTIDVLIQDAGSKLWRARVGACGALADVIVGRSWEDLGGGKVELDDEGSGMKATASIRLLRLWKIAMRALDDVRTAVRERGESLGRALRALTIRLCDPTMSDISQESDVYLSNTQRKQREKQSQITAEYAATVSLGWLVKYGLNQSCAEATGISISCLLGIVDVAKPETLQPVLAELIGSLLMAMSGLEPAALNYLQVRAAGNDANTQGNSGSDRYDQLERLRINLALSGPIAGALHKCLEMAKHVDLEAQRKLIPELDSSLRKGAGFATRAATADAVGSLCGACPAAFSFPGSNMSNPTVRLLRALYFASERERGVTAKDKMTHALGSLAELAPGKAVRILALKACERYCESSGSNNDPSIRKAAAATIRAIAVRASNHLADGGPKEIWCKKVLPTAFLGRHDKDAKVSSLWKDVWEEGGSAISSMDGSEDMFGVLLQEKLLPYIVKATVSALQSTSWANRKAGCAVLVELTDAVLVPTPRSTGDHINYSEEDINRLRQRAKASSVLLSECLRIIARNRIWDGKGDVVKAATNIAGRWSAAAPIDGKTTEMSEHCIWPLVLRKDCQDDLFEGDSWFKISKGRLSEENDEAGRDDANGTANETDGGISEDDTALDLSGENDLGDDEQHDGENTESDAEENLGNKPVVFSGFCRVLLDQALRTGSNNSTEGVLPYKASALSGLSALLKSVGPSKDSAVYDDIVQHKRFIYDLIAPSMYSFVVETQSSNGKTPPLLIARALECLASAMYDGIGADAGQGEYANAVGLLKFFSGTKHPAWTVRQMSALAATSLVANMPSDILKKNEVITTVLECSNQTLKDKKFWKVRLAGLELLLSLVSRVGNQKMSIMDSDKQLIMEAILPYKERIIDVARKSLTDNESQVTATASKITLTMAWWP